MKSRGVVGKRITRIRQTREWNSNARRWYYNLHGIELEDGTMLVPWTEETEGDYGHGMFVLKGPRKKLAATG